MQVYSLSRSKNGLSHLRKGGIVLSIAVAIQAFPVPAAFSKPVNLEERTTVRVAIKETISSRHSKKDAEVCFEVREDLLGPNRELLVAKGTPAYGRIVKVKRPGMFGKAGKLEFTCDYTTAVDGTKVALSNTGSGETRGKNMKNTAIGVGLLVAWPAIFIKGRDASVPKDTEFTVYVAKNTPIDPAKAQVAVSPKK